MVETSSSVSGRSVQTFDLRAESFDLFFRSLAVMISAILLIPLPWVTCWFFRWMMSQIRIGDGQTIEFHGTPKTFEIVAVLFGLTTTLPLLILATDAGLPIVRFMAQLGGPFYLWFYIRWIINHSHIWGCSLHFNGSVWAFVGWYLLSTISALTIIGPFWVTAGATRWLARHIQHPEGQIRFIGKGHQLLWRTFAMGVGSILIITIPWVFRWYSQWFTQQFEIHRQT